MVDFGEDVRDLKEELERLASERRWSEIAARLPEDIDEGWLSGEPKVAFTLAEALAHLGRSERALELSLLAESSFSARHDSPNLMSALNLSGAIQFELGDLAEAEGRFSDLRELAWERGDEEMVGRATNNLGTLASLRGNHEGALSLYQLAIPAYQRAGHRLGLAQTAHNLGIAYRDIGRPREARRQYKRAIRAARRLGDKRLVAMAMVGEAELLHKKGDDRFAEKAGLKALELYTDVGDELGRADALRMLAGAAGGLGDADSAFARYETALELARKLASPLLEAEILDDRAGLHQERQDASSALADLRASLDIYHQLGAEERVRDMEERIAGIGSND